MPTPSDDLNDALLSLPRGAKDHLGRDCLLYTSDAADE